MARDARSAAVAVNTDLRDREYAKGAHLWCRMRATFGDLPDAGFRYASRERGVGEETVYAVFDGATAILRRDDAADPPRVSVTWEGQAAPTGWIGIEGVWCNRGAPLAAAPALPGVRPGFFEKMYSAVSHDERPYLSDFSLERRRHDVPGAVPILDVGVDYERATIVFDGKDVCAVGRCPPEDMPLPAFFDRVRADPAYWIGLYNHVVKNADSDW